MIITQRVGVLFYGFMGRGGGIIFLRFIFKIFKKCSYFQIIFLE